MTQKLIESLKTSCFLIQHVHCLLLLLMSNVYSLLHKHMTQRLFLSQDVLIQNKWQLLAQTELRENAEEQNSQQKDWKKGCIVWIRHCSSIRNLKVWSQIEWITILFYLKMYAWNDYWSKQGYLLYFLSILFAISLKLERVSTHIFRHSCKVMWLVLSSFLRARKKYSLGTVDKKFR